MFVYGAWGCIKNYPFCSYRCRVAHPEEEIYFFACLYIPGFDLLLQPPIVKINEIPLFNFYIR